MKLINSIAFVGSSSQARGEILALSFGILKVVLLYTMPITMDIVTRLKTQNDDMSQIKNVTDHNKVIPQFNVSFLSFLYVYHLPNSQQFIRISIR